MAIVNPPPQLKIPENILKDPQWLAYERQRDIIIFQLWQRTGGNVDVIEDSQQNITSSSSRVSRNAARINSLELKEFEIVNTTTDITTGDDVTSLNDATIPANSHYWLETTLQSGIVNELAVTPIWDYDL